MDPDARLKAALKSQYHASLTMLHESIDRCPDMLWYSTTPTNAFWQVAYHAVFFAHLYLMPTEADFRPWPGHQGRVQHPDGIPGRVDPESALPLIPAPYARTDVLTYLSICDAMVDEAVDVLDLESEASGFDWYPISKLEHQLVNLRHIQHHTAQLADRLRTFADIGVNWRGAQS